MLPYRKSTRLQGYDYSNEGLYFITICVNERKPILGIAKDWEMNLNDNGKIVLNCWYDLPNHYDNVILHDFCIMPNHIHGIIQLSNERAGLKPAPTTKTTQPLSEIVRALKTFSARKINEKNGTQGCPLWQRNYYEHIIRSDSMYTTISDYIKENPKRWIYDQFYFKENT